MLYNILGQKQQIPFNSNNLKETKSNRVYNFLKSAKVNSLREINDSTYTGATLEELPIDTFVKLKEMGIETVIDLRLNSKTSYIEKCRSSNINYFKFPLDFIFNPGKSDIFIGNNRSLVNNSFVQNLKKFLELTKKGNLYMGCQYGLDRTNFAIIMNYLFNYDSNDVPPQILSSDIGKSKTLLNKDLDLIRKILKKMTMEQKHFLNLPQNYNEIIIKRIRELVMHV